ncbi:MAG: NUDIX hydrolase [Shimia sp.]
MNDPSVLRAALACPAQPSSDYDLNPGVALPPQRKLRDAAILILFSPEGLVLTKRSAALKHHPGQIACPGGKRDAGDASLWDCAVREAREEIGLITTPEALGELPAHETVTGFTVTPFVAWLPTADAWVPELGEVEEVFTLPAAHVLTVANYRIEGRAWQGITRHYYAAPFGPYYLWGATARILRGLAALL